ncbi:hypothetical protein SAMD00019534_102970 [Acytostelium subglobosum LB1]|uniref:hypothetical protein n=1 Tax=Acytostelium subglobosum LB1 TaxID=1410327 RepID=UPI000644E328|nr:hypothetical protein SAMD00019534_102970 [Acytostelium subglobosum LB1]GAM27122.1 hypothetical protein SAMD00019534_102970 [Acytostelium subglobosum LB1]|eukprot:XP_012750002.1 hypothetical protein SAMD00019534_102970 [Acytostelium subglobosum LB1]
MISVFQLIEIVAIVLYSFLLIVCLISFWKSFQRNEFALISRIFHLFIFLFVLCRILWYTLRVAEGETPWTFILNNFGFLFDMTGLSVILFFWIEQYYQTYVASTEFFPTMKMTFVAINLAMYGIEIILVSLFFTVNHSRKEGSTVYLLNTLYQADTNH